jgi:hypothetical protein
MKKPALMPVFLCPGMDGMAKMPGAFFRRNLQFNDAFP